jgi:branched-subunit amino acid aminotransferase/4-amino-4-deoxychorismate lyase
MNGPSAGGRVAIIDGVLFAPDEAKVSVYDRGFVFGDAIFEVLRTYRGVPFALDEHFARSTTPRCETRWSAPSRRRRTPSRTFASS